MTTRLTKVEEEIMQHIWDLDRCTVRDILDQLTESTPHSTISSIVRILEKKGFVGHKAYGRTHEYFPLIDKKAYSKKSLGQIIANYFEGSPERLVSFLISEKELGLKELNALITDDSDASEKK